MNWPAPDPATLIAAASCGRCYPPFRWDWGHLHLKHRRWGCGLNGRDCSCHAWFEQTGHAR